MGCRRWIIAGLVVLLGCSGRPVEDPVGADGDGTRGDGTDGQTSGTTGDPGDATTTGGDVPASESSGDSSDSGDSGGPDPCADFVGDEGSPCEPDGLQCTYADFCGGYHYECQQGVWVAIDGFGCNGEHVDCEDAEPGDDCTTSEVCEPDDDCMDVLECIGYQWTFRELCTELTCAQNPPQHGTACAEDGLSCSIDHECGPKLFTCHDGYWNFNGSGICTYPVPCEDGPVPNEGCDMVGEVCEYDNPDEPPIVCTDQGVWD